MLHTLADHLEIVLALEGEHGVVRVLVGQSRQRHLQVRHVDDPGRVALRGVARQLPLEVDLDCHRLHHSIHFTGTIPITRGDSLA